MAASSPLYLGCQPGKLFQNPIFVSRGDEMPRTVHKLNLATGKRALWRVLAPADPVGVIGIYGIQISADEQSYCYTYGRNISDLYLVEGLR